MEDKMIGITKVNLNDGCTVEELIEVLSTLPQNYEFLCMGLDSNIALAIDHDNGMISIDELDRVNEMITIEAVTFDEKENE